MLVKVADTERVKHEGIEPAICLKFICKYSCTTCPGVGRHSDDWVVVSVSALRFRLHIVISLSIA